MKVKVQIESSIALSRYFKLLFKQFKYCILVQAHKQGHVEVKSEV